MVFDVFHGENFGLIPSLNKHAAAPSGLASRGPETFQGTEL